MIVIFDLDGTVWDSHAGIIGSLEHTFESLEMDVPAGEVLAANIGPPLQLMLAELGIPDELNDLATAHYRDRYLTWGAYEASVYPGVHELLEQLADAGHRLATATSKGEDPARQMLEHFGLTDRFEVIGAASMDASATTKEVVIERTLERLGDPPAESCRMIGDRSYDVAGAATHGIDTIGVLWGYGSEQELREAGARRLAAQPAQIAELIQS